MPVKIRFFVVISFNVFINFVVIINEVVETEKVNVIVLVIMGSIYTSMVPKAEPISIDF